MKVFFYWVVCGVYVLVSPWFLYCEDVEFSGVSAAGGVSLGALGVAPSSTTDAGASASVVVWFWI